MDTAAIVETLRDFWVFAVLGAATLGWLFGNGFVVSYSFRNRLRLLAAALFVLAFALCQMTAFALAVGACIVFATFLLGMTVSVNLQNKRWTRKALVETFGAEAAKRYAVALYGPQSADSDQDLILTRTIDKVPAQREAARIVLRTPTKITPLSDASAVRINR